MRHAAGDAYAPVILLLQSLLYGNSLLREVLTVEERAEKVTFYTSPVMSEEQPGYGEGLSDGPHATVPSTATRAKDTGRDRGSSQPT